MNNERGFTIVEVIVAIMILSVGLLALASSAAVATRMISQGQRYSEASVMANERFEILRSLPCDSLKNGSATADQFTVAWRVTSVASGRARQADVAVMSPTGRGNRTDSFGTVILC